MGDSSPRKAKENHGFRGFAKGSIRHILEVTQKRGGLEEHSEIALVRFHRSLLRIRGFRQIQCNRGKFPGERGLAYAGAGRMRLARGGIFGPGTPRRSPMKS